MERFQIKDAQKRGTIKRIDYKAVNPAGEKIDKYANVYLPYNYSEENKYNILYLMHGGSGSPDAWLDLCPVKNMFDNLILDGEIEPLIVVFPTYYTGQWKGLVPEWETEQTLFFMNEVADKLFPAVESKFSTYAESTDKEGLAASRKHRAFGGFSMGGCVTWWMFMHHLDEVANFIPLSGDCWIKCVHGGSKYPDETAEALHDVAVKSGKDFFIYALTGTKDIAYEMLSCQTKAMKKYTDTFSEKNFLDYFEEGYEHCYLDVMNYVRKALPKLFK